MSETQQTKLSHSRLRALDAVRDLIAAAEAGGWDDTANDAILNEGRAAYATLAAEIASDEIMLRQTIGNVLREYQHMGCLPSSEVAVIAGKISTAIVAHCSKRTDQ